MITIRKIHPQTAGADTNIMASLCIPCVCGLHVVILLGTCTHCTHDPDRLFFDTTERAFEGVQHSEECLLLLAQEV